MKSMTMTDEKYRMIAEGLLRYLHDEAGHFTHEDDECNCEIEGNYIMLTFNEDNIEHCSGGSWDTPADYEIRRRISIDKIEVMDAETDEVVTLIDYDAKKLEEELNWVA